MFINQFTFSLIFSDYFQNFIFLSSNKYSTRKNLNFGKFDVMKVSRILNPLSAEHFLKITKNLMKKK